MQYPFENDEKHACGIPYLPSHLYPPTLRLSTKFKA